MRLASIAYKIPNPMRTIISKIKNWSNRSMIMMWNSYSELRLLLYIKSHIHAPQQMRHKHPVICPSITPTNALWYLLDPV